ncbi:hypothetical protein PL683_01910 [Phocaeicola vulgatus]|uniref:hypothetical protein n=1 Tax=Phocaeicola vulgatus TaxID=821 RepID=UPI00189D8BC1|nr:hypothetical protein [Phocaeicola vulgatus]MDB1018577.1 hypothetical protein [Phocaeicola vulgatus]
MKIHSLCGRLRMRVCDFERRERMWKTGLAQAMRLSPPKGSVPEIIETVLLVPITNDLCRKTGKAIRYRQTLAGSFTLLYGNRPFAVIFLPNPRTGRIFIKYLNSNGVQCTALKELWDTDEIAEFISRNLP